MRSCASRSARSSCLPSRNDWRAPCSTFRSGPRRSTPGARTRDCCSTRETLGTCSRSSAARASSCRTPISRRARRPRARWSRRTRARVRTRNTSATTHRRRRCARCHDEPSALPSRHELERSAHRDPRAAKTAVRSRCGRRFRHRRAGAARNPPRARRRVEAPEHPGGGGPQKRPRIIACEVDFDLTQDQREIQALARELARAEIDPHASQWDREHHFPRELFGKLADVGLMGVCVPEEYGGAGADFLSYILVLEELSRADAGVGVTVAVHTSATTMPILAFGTDEQRSRFVPPLARGEVLGAFALTEPESGSDAGSLRTAAIPSGEGWTISGSKQWITNASHAGTFVLFARTDASTPGPRGVSAFILAAQSVRVTRERRS